MSSFELMHIRGRPAPKKKVCNFVGGVVSPILANIYLHEFDDSPFALERSQKLNFRRVLCDLGQRYFPPMKFSCYALSQAANLGRGGHHESATGATGSGDPWEKRPGDHHGAGR